MRGILNFVQVYHAGLFTENSLILVEGVYYDGTLKVQGLAMPPLEPSKTSRYELMLKSFIVFSVD